jgi:hypothetical protein
MGPLSNYPCHGRSARAVLCSASVEGSGMPGPSGLSKFLGTVLLGAFGTELVTTVRNTKFGRRLCLRRTLYGRLFVWENGVPGEHSC